MDQATRDHLALISNQRKEQERQAKKDLAALRSRRRLSRLGRRVLASAERLGLSEEAAQELRGLVSKI